MPLVSLMAGRVSVVSVLANVAVTPVVSIALLLGLAATILTVLPLPFPAEAVALKLAEPVVWWIYRVASWAQDLPLAHRGHSVGRCDCIWLDNRSLAGGIGADHHCCRYYGHVVCGLAPTPTGASRNLSG